MATNKIKAIQINSKALNVDEINTLIANKGIYQLPEGFTGQANVKIEFTGNEIPEGIFKNIDTITDVKLPEKTNENGEKEIAVTIGNNAFEGTSLNLDKLKEIYTINPDAINDKKDYVKQSIKVDEVNKEIEELNQVKEGKVAQIEKIVENDGDSVAKEMLQAEIELLEYNIIYKEKFAEIETVKLEKELAITEIRMEIKKAEKVQAKAVLNGESTTEIDSQISTLKSDLRVAKADKDDYAQTVAEDQTLQAVINNIVAKLQQLQILADEASDVLEAYETSQLDHEDVVVPEEPQTYTITFYNDGESVKTVNGVTGTIVETPVVEKEGYTFNGWSIDGEHIVLPITNIGDSDISYIAKWTQNEQGGSEVIPEIDDQQYVYVGQINPLDEEFSFNMVQHNGTSIIKQPITSKIDVQISLSGSRDYWYIVVPNNLGYEMYDSFGATNVESLMDHTTKIINGTEYKIYWTSVKSVKIDQYLK